MEELRTEFDEISNEEELEEASEDQVDEVIDDNKLMAYDIAVFYNTYNLSTLMKWWDNKLIVPGFQRSYVWTKKAASEFVDSILRGLPVPSIFFYDDNENNRLLVVDGQQRLRSLYFFIKEQQFNGKAFDLIGNIHPNWRKKTYEQLEPEDRDRLDDALLNITVMRQLAPDDGQSAMYLAFQRINTGGKTLTAQEIRMAVSYGPLAIYLDELSRKSEFEKWSFLRTKSQRDNGNYSAIQELILKVWTYYMSYPSFSGSSTRSMLDDFFSNEKDFDAPKKKKPSIEYYSKETLEEVFDAAFEELCTLDEKHFTPYSKPTQTFLESVWVGLIHRKLKLKKEINSTTLPAYIENWKHKIELEDEGKEENRFSNWFQSRRTSSTSAAEARIRAGIEYFSGDF